MSEPLRTSLCGIIIILLLGACNINTKETEKEQGFAKSHEFADLWFNQSAEMKACYLQTYKFAALLLDKHLADYKHVKKPAIVLDLDETVLDNSPYQMKLLELNTEYTFQNWTEWVELAKAKALPGSFSFIANAKSKGVEVFYISNRSIKHIDATIKNLQTLNFPNADTNYVLLRDKTSDKTERRNKVAQNYEIILYLGDNLADFSQAFSDRSKETMGKDIVDENEMLIGDKYIIFPNPMYGEWEKTMYNNKYDYTPEQKDSLRQIIIHSGY